MDTDRRFRTIMDALSFRASAQANSPAYHHLADDAMESGLLTWKDLDSRARSLGEFFVKAGARGERALLLYQTGLDYVAAFYGCLYGGVIAVPAYPPRMNRHHSRILAIVEDCAPRYVLTDSSMIGKIRAALPDHPSLHNVEWIATDMLDAGGTGWAPESCETGTTAFLQYTSGSTGTPKGVMVSHGNLTRNLGLISSGFGVTEESVIVSWLPIYHDMGLIGNILATAWVGAECYMMSPAAFVRRPLSWLEAISRFEATASGGPNFAFDLCVQKIPTEDCARLDLSRWRTACNGAEPIRAATMERFAAKFQPFGFRPQAFFPCYGMAEATLFVTGGTADQGAIVRRLNKEGISPSRAVRCESRDAETCVSSGHAHVDRVIIVDPASRVECGAGTVGEIWISDASVAQGYWRKPELSAETFGAHVASTGEGPFLRTGDLGVIDGGELFVLGRLKDLIIIRGRNLYPQDIEATAESSSTTLCARGVIAFGAERYGEERLVIAAEVVREQRSRLNADAVGEAVSRAIAAEHGVSPAEIVFIQPASTMKTSSGKLQRSATRKAYMEGTLETITTWRNTSSDAPNASAGHTEAPCTPVTDLHGWLASVVSAKLNIPLPHLDRRRPIAEYGLDSLAGVELIAEIEEKLGIEVPFESLFIGEPSLTQLALTLSEKLALISAKRSGDEIRIPLLAQITALSEQEVNPR